MCFWKKNKRLCVKFAKIGTNNVREKQGIKKQVNWKVISGNQRNFMGSGEIGTNLRNVN
jgi:hypothetical protein